VRPELKENETKTWKIMQEVASLQGMYIVFVMFQTAIVKGRNRNSYESVLGENNVGIVSFHFIFGVLWRLSKGIVNFVDMINFLININQ
jgi:hypothetical protein